MSAISRERLQSALGAAYTLGRELGGGGMSRVFVAREEALGREVVVKVLAPELAEGLSAERFAREIRLAAALQEPHIVPVLAAGTTADGLPYYTMPYVRGESLRHRLSAGRLPAAEGLSVLRDVARALAYAHREGVVHRDIKPENVLLSEGTAVVTDFGIARAISAARTQAGVGDRAEPAATLTRVGTSLGTPAYMAPEQAAGDAVDHRADLYAWGVVAYELLAGSHPFAGRATAQQLIAAHIAEPPPRLGARAPGVPPAVAALVMRCLEKSPAARPAAADELVRALEAPAAAGGSGRAGRRAAALALGAAALAAAGAAALAVVRRAPAPPALGATAQVTAAPGLELDAALSPDGGMLAWVEPRAGLFRVVVRQRDGGRAVVVADTGGPQRAPRWSPDGTRLLYASLGAVYVVPALGGTPREVVRTGDDFLRSNPTPAWSPDGRLVAYADDRGIVVRPLDGGAPRVVAGGIGLHSPAWSPDGRRIAYVAGNRQYVTIVGNTSPSAIWTAPSDGGAPTRVTAEPHLRQLNASPAWTADGRGLLYVSNAGGTRDVHHVGLDRDFRPAGEPTRLTAGLEPFTISLSADGRLLAYSALRLRANVWTAPIRPDGPTPVTDMAQVTRENQRVEGLDLSPDGRTLVFDANRRGNADIFSMPFAGGDPVQLTDDPADDFQPVWSPDGARVAFYSTRAGSRDVYVMDADGRNVERLTAFPGQERYPSWSPDGTRLVFDADATGTEELYVVERRPGGGWTAPVRLTRGGAGYPRWSPDGRWISALRRGALLLVPAADAAAGRVPPGGVTPRVVAGPSAAGDGLVAFTAWGKAADRVVVARIEPRELRWSYWSLPVAGGAPRRLLSFDVRNKATGGVTFATDGRRLIFTLAADDADVWTMTLR